MVKITFTSSWIGIGLMLLCLGMSGGCCCADKAGKPPLPSAMCIDPLPPGPTVCGPGYGYHPTCWMAWSDCCRTCPPPEQVVPLPRGPAGDTPSGDGVRPPNRTDLEVVPVPHEEPRAKLPNPPKAEEPPPMLEKHGKAKEPPPMLEKTGNAKEPDLILEKPLKAKEPKSKLKKPGKAEKSKPKLEESPKAEPPLTKAKEPRPKLERLPKVENCLTKAEEPSIVPIQPSMDDSGRSKPECADWEEAPLPKHYAKSSVPDKLDVYIPPVPKSRPRILDSHSGSRELAPTRDMYFAVLVPERRSILPEIRRVVFWQEENGGGDRQQDK
jgi:hypothetical protein